MRYLTPAALVAALAGTVVAQPDHFTSAPLGYEFQEGNSDSRDVIGTEPLLRYQQIDSTLLVAEANRNQIAFRRDGQLFDNPLYGARAIEMEVVFAESDLSAISTTFDDNYRANRQVVMARKTVQFEDWTLSPALPPAPLAAGLFLDTQYTYPGKTASGRDFLWEVRVWSNTQAGKPYPFDFEFVVPSATFGTPVPTVSQNASLGSGCSVPGAAAPFLLSPRVLNDGSLLSMQGTVFFGPAASPVVLFVDGLDSALSVPSLLCGTLHVLPTISVPMGVTDGSGIVTMPTVPLGYKSTWLGLDLFAQAVAPCAGCGPAGGIDVALTDGVRMTLPQNPPAPAVGRVWALDPDAVTATVGPEPGGIILHMNHP